MEPEGTRLLEGLAPYVRRVYWATFVLLLLLALAGCLTSYAAGPLENSKSLAATSEPSTPTATTTPTPSLTAAPATTLVPNMSVRAFQTITPTATATATVTPTLEPTTTAAPTNTPVSTNTAVPTPTATPLPTNTPNPTTILATPPPFEAHVWVDDYIVEPGQVVTVFGRLLRNRRPVEGANMGTTWRFTNSPTYCSAYTNIQGIAACSINIGARLEGYWAFIDAIFTIEDVEVYARTAFFVDP